MCVEKQAQILSLVLDGALSVEKAAKKLGCSSRTVWRKIKRFREAGKNGLVHGLTGKRSNSAKPGYLKNRVITLYQDSYQNLALSSFTKALAQDGINVSRETIRQWLIGAGMWEGRIPVKSVNSI